ncbi:syntaxin binding protein 1, putative [Trypanosoma brucei gambiense DAL972]|uniref:Syntaxin binding protein 1, putative n=1 Tax=Trypanosoma brucei gambiense (strain MHOM/CI/86/DAL972) TaxID=679716 RepID=C9ZX51_TRYB9|nr:syntaxin binding protein 1, putative [Trypanosoma brucei gambiense DAL972]CBH13993.1 syntaxin binding protein 1, putative [Trypanosoma brucei gambiense DAL972]|eukprot:XP_011776266.1 syntaxin binding protein 1, putative [Trypanosoma brucei gambiense DAL972]
MMSNHAKLSKQKPPESPGIRSCVQRYVFKNMLDAVPGKYKVIICDTPSAVVLNSFARMNDLMEHGVALVEDLKKKRQPLICLPAMYFFDPNDESVERIIDDWEEKDPYKEVHLFALGTTPDSYMQRLARARVAQRVTGFKDMMLNFLVPERLVFHFNMQNDLSRLMLPMQSPQCESFLSEAAARLTQVLHAMGGGIPVVRAQGRSQSCEVFSRLLLDELAKLAISVPNFENGVDDDGVGSSKPVLIILDRSFDTVTPLMHHRTYQCLLEDLMPLENDMYVQKFETRSGERSTRELSVDEEDPYWCQYRHRFFAECMEEFPAELKKLHNENPHLVNTREASPSITELSNVTRVLSTFQKDQGRLSVHIDICTKIFNLYREQCLDVVCEAEQDIAAGRKSFKTNFETVRHIIKDPAVPRDVRLRLLLLLSAATDTSEYSEAKKQTLIKQSELTEVAGAFSKLEQLTSRVGKLNPEGRNAKSSAEKDPFITQTYQIMEALAGNKLDTADYKYVTRSDESSGDVTSNTAPSGGANTKKSLRVALGSSALWSDKGSAISDTLSSASEKPLAAIAALPPLPKAVHDLAGTGNVGGRSSKQRFVFFVLGGITFSEIRAAHEATKKLGCEFIIGGTSLLRPNEFVKVLSE